MFGMRYTPCRNMPRKRSKSIGMPERGYRGVSRKSKAHFKVRWNSPRIAAHAAPYLRDQGPGGRHPDEVLLGYAGTCVHCDHREPLCTCQRGSAEKGNKKTGCISSSSLRRVGELTVRYCRLRDSTMKKRI